MPEDERKDAALSAVARELYGQVPGDFVAARNARAAELRRAGQRGLAGQVRALPRATAAAWAVGAVLRAEPAQVDALGELGAELRLAQRAGAPTELRALSRRRRELTAAVTRTAARLAEEHGVALSAAAAEQVRATWQAVVIDPRAEQAARSLLLLRGLDPGDLETLGTALAVPAAVPEPAGDDLAPGVPRARQPADDAAVGKAPSSKTATGAGRRAAPSADHAREARRLERELRARHRAAEQAQQELAGAREELSEVEARVLRTAALVEELRRSLEELEDELVELDEERSTAREEQEDAAARVEEAEAAVVRVRDRLAGLTAQTP